jgi:hypothetical protein
MNPRPLRITGVSLALKDRETLLKFDPQNEVLHHQRNRRSAERARAYNRRAAPSVTKRPSSSWRNDLLEVGYHPSSSIASIAPIARERKPDGPPTETRRPRFGQ